MLSRSNPDRSDVELIDLLHILRRRWWIVVVILFACLGGSLLATERATKRYQADTRLIVSGNSGVSPIDEIARRQLAQQRAVAYSQIASTPPAVNAAIAQASSAGPFGPGGPLVTATASGSDPFIQITVRDTNPRRAAAVANAYVSILPRVINQLESAPSAVRNELSVVSGAGVPSKPYTPNALKNSLIGIVVGLVLGLGAAFVREALDRRLRDSEEVQTAAGVEVLGVVPNEIGETNIPVETHPMSARAEAYRKVRTNLSFTTADGMPSSVLVTSSTSGEGKTTLATNLALACARTGYKVVLVDADLRRPMVAEYMGIEERAGLTSWLTGASDLADVVRPFGDGAFPVDVITSGPIPANPSELLGSERMQRLLQHLEEDYDIVVVDAPPVLPVADSLVLAVLVKAVVLVAKVGDTTRDRLRRSREAIVQVSGNLVGVVPNYVVQREDSAYAYAYRYRGKGDDTLKLYTKQARLPEIDEAGKPVVGSDKARAQK